MATLSRSEKLKYACFISYSHAVDGKLTAALQQGLQKFAKPWNRMRALRVFRDKTGLSVNAALWPSIEQALSKSEYFILMASPQAAASEWVCREIDYWLEHRSTDKLFIVLTDGDLVWQENNRDFLWNQETPLPTNLRDVFEYEPLYVDLRWARDTTEHLSLNHNSFREAIADLAATLHNRPKQDLIGEDVRQHKKIKFFTRASIVALSVLTIFATIASITAVIQRNEAEQQRNDALSSQSHLLTEVARQELQSGSATKASLLALAALPQDIKKPNRPYVIDAEAVLYQSVLSQREIATYGEPKAAIYFVTFSPDGSHFVTTAWDGKARVFDSDSGDEISTFRGHTGPVFHASFSPDGSRIATVSSDNTARVWDMHNGTEISVMSGHSREPLHVAFSSDGSRIATTSIDNTARVWDADSGRQIVMVKTGSSKSVAFSHDASEFVTVSSDSARVWSATDGRLKHEFSAEGGKGTRFVFSSDYDRLLVADATKKVGEKSRLRLWDTIDGTLIAELPEHKYPIKLAAFSNTNDRLVTVSQSGLTRIWNTTTGQKVNVLPGRGFAFNADGRYIALTIEGDERNVRVWDVHNNTEKVVLDGHTAKARHVVFSYDGSRIATISVDGTVRIWDTDTGIRLGLLGGFPDLHFYRGFRANFSAMGNRLTTHTNNHVVSLWNTTHGDLILNLPTYTDAISYAAFSTNGDHVITASADKTARIFQTENGVELTVLDNHNAALTHAEFNTKGDLVITASEDGTARVWNAIDGAERMVLSAHAAAVRFAAFNLDGTRIITFSDDETARLWDATNNKVIASFRGKDIPLHAAFSPNGKDIAIAFSGKDRTIQIRDTKNGALINNLRGHRGPIIRIAFSPDGKFLVSGSKGGTARVWDIHQGAEILKLVSQNERTVWDVAFSTDGRQIVTASEDETACIWDATTGTQLLKYTEHKGRVYRVAASPDGRFIASYGLDDQRVHIWNAHTGTTFAVLNQMGSFVRRVTFSPDSKRLLIASKNGTAQIVTVFSSTQELIDYAQKTVPRQLTEDERKQYFLEKL